MPSLREAIGAAVAPYLVDGQEQDVGIADAVIDALASLPLPVILDTLGIKCRSLYTSADWVDPELIVLAVLEPSRICGDVQVLVVDNPAADDAAP